MKLDELKVALIKQFFKSSDSGVDQDRVKEVFESMAKRLDTDLSHLSEQDAVTEDSEMHSGVSSEPSKAFRKFTEGRKALLTINEDDGSKAMSLFAAFRVGTEIMICNLTNETIKEEKSNLNAVKQALRQAKNLNDDIYFQIQNDEHKRPI